MASYLGLVEDYLGTQNLSPFRRLALPCSFQEARLLHRKGKGPARPYMNTEVYPKHIALVLIIDMLKRWLRENPEFCMLISGPGARHLTFMSQSTTLDALER